MTTKSRAAIGGLGLLLAGAGGSLAQDASMSAELAPGLTATVISLKQLPGQKIVQIDYELRNTGSDVADIDEAGLTGLDHVNGIGLLDFGNERVYEVGSADGCLCSKAPDGDKLAAGETFKGWAWFAPPETVKGKLAVRFGTARPILDVPLQ